MLCFDYSQERSGCQPQTLKNLSTKNQSLSTQKNADSTDEKSNSTVSRVAVFRR